MASENLEVVGCDASIMRNVWEIREREYGQKMQQEQDRIERSALSVINKDWENRLAVRMGKGTRIERKGQKKPAESLTDTSNVWKSKLPEGPPTLPRGPGSGALGRPGAQKRGLSTSTSNKEKKMQDKNLEKLQLLMFIAQTQPSTMVWGKSWKFNKSLPLAEEGAVSDWGRCWMFAAQQPYSEPGKPWLNGPNLMDPHNLHLWKKPDYRVVESEELDMSLTTEEWQMSWRKNTKKDDKSSENEENFPKSEFFTSLVETQRHNEDLCSSEWSESWRSTKPSSEQDSFNAPHDGLMNESVANNHNKDREMSSIWEECWKLVNHLGCNKSKAHEVKKSHSPEWVNSWRAAMVVLDNHKNSDPALSQDHLDSYSDHSHQKESHFHKIMRASHEHKHRDLYMQFCEEFKALSEWSKSYQVTKNNSKPSEEIEKILKIASSRMETVVAPNMEKTKVNDPTSEKTDPHYEQLRHSVIYHPKRELTQNQLLRLQYLKNAKSAPEWTNSWKALKHRMRMERRRMRPDPSRPFRAPENGGDMRPTTSEWKDSWKFTCQPLGQDPEQWQQGWTTMPQIRVDRAREHNHFAPVESPKNGPTAERSWVDSWRLSRPQLRPEHGQDRAHTSQGMSSMASQQLDHSQRHRAHTRSVFDWQEAWMVSETEFRHDRPSFTQWREAWRASVVNIEHWSEQERRENRMNELMEIQPWRHKISLERAQAKMSRSFNNQMFRERYPEREWTASWKAASILNHQPSQCGPLEKSMSSSSQQKHVSTNGHGSKWGMSFRIANPMPQVEQPWVESSSNPSHYAAMWSRAMHTQNNINTKFSNNPAAFRLWGNSHQFLQGVSAQNKNKTKSKEPVDPRVIVTRKTKTWMHLYSNIEKEKQSGRGGEEKRWAGCYLLGKTQPRPKRGPSSSNKLKMGDNNVDTKFFDEWAESWRFLVNPRTLKKQMSMKAPSGWDEAWKFLLPPFPPMNGPKAR